MVFVITVLSWKEASASRLPAMLRQAEGISIMMERELSPAVDASDKVISF